MSDHYQAAISAYQSGQFRLAAEQMAQFIKTDPNNAEGWHLLGIMHFQDSAYSQAVNAFEKATQLKPQQADFLNNLGLALKANGQLSQSISAYELALRITPKDKDLQLNLANAFMESNRHEEAAGLYRRLIHQSRQQANTFELMDALCYALTQMGNAAHAKGQFSMAEACFAEAIKLKPKESHLFFNLANAERELSLTKQAVTHYQRAIELNPSHADAYNNLGNALRELGQIDAAILQYERALSINPNLHHARVHLIHQKQHACDWADLDTNIQSTRELVNQSSSAQISPFAFLSMPGTTSKEQLTCANQWVKQRYENLVKTTPTFPQRTIFKKPKLKIGYLSADFRLHPLAFLITDLIESHDRHQFEINAYSFGPRDQTPTRKRLMNAFDAFHEIQQYSEVEAAEKIHADEIDILVDLTGFTQTSRSGIIALRPAAIHVSWLGFPGTMGYLDSTAKEPLFDYLITDDTITPPENAECYAEHLAYLDCYQPNDRKRPIGKVPSREACSLPVDAFVYCAFNQSFKITPEIFASWMRILKATPNSVLWLLECHETTKQHLLSEANVAGIDPTRLIFAPRVSIETHLARHQNADLFLDTPTYNAHTTCSDALWMGLPVLTRIGSTFASRVAASLVKSVGLPRMIVNTTHEYEARAIDYAKHPETLADVKKTLNEHKEKAFLFNTPVFTEALEVLYQTMWQKKLNGISG